MKTLKAMKIKLSNCESSDNKVMNTMKAMKIKSSTTLLVILSIHRYKVQQKYIM